MKKRLSSPFQAQRGIGCSDDSLRDYALENGQLKLRSSSSIRFANAGATPSVSADGAKNAAVWAIATKTWNGPGQPAVLYAFDANHLSEPIYASEQNSKRRSRGAGDAVRNSAGGEWARLFWRERRSGSVWTVEIEEQGLGIGIRERGWA